MNALQEKWQALTHSEKKLLTYGSLLVVIVVLYYYAWVPYGQFINHQKQQIQYTQEDIGWLSAVGKQIKALQKTGIGNQQINFQGSLIDVIDKSISNHRLNKNVISMETSGQDLVVAFEAISFNRLILWIDELDKRYGIIVKSFDLEKEESKALVDSRIILKK